MRKKIIAILIAAVLLMPLALVFAQERWAFQVTVVTEDSTSAEISAGAWIYGVGMYATGSNGVVGIYDYDGAVANAGTARAKIEVGHATSGMTTTTWLEKPIYITNGVSVKCTNAYAFIYTGPAP